MQFNMLTQWAPFLQRTARPDVAQTRDIMIVSSDDTSKPGKKTSADSKDINERRFACSTQRQRYRLASKGVHSPAFCSPTSVTSSSLAKNSPLSQLSRAVNMLTMIIVVSDDEQGQAR